MVLVKPCCVILILVFIQTIGHELYVAKKDYSASFTKLEVRNAQNCIEACNQNRKCGAFAFVDQGDSVDCFIEDHFGKVRLIYVPIMVKNYENKCEEGCSDGFTTLGGLVGGCYRPVMNQRVQWVEAEAACRELHCAAHLIRINNIKKRDVVREYMIHNGVYSIWTGAQDLDRDRIFTWIGSADEVESDMWMPGEPNSPQFQHCVNLNLGLLRSVDCALPLRYICEIQMGDGEN